MKTKDKEIQKKINELCKLMGDDDRFIVFRKSGNVVDIALPKKEDEKTDFRISSSLATVIDSYLINESDNVGVERLSEIIIDTVEALIGTSPKASIELQKRFLKASLIGLNMSMKELNSDIKDFVEDEDAEDCSECELVRTCNDDAAIKYRKEHGIPKPKKGKKGGHNIYVN